MIHLGQTEPSGIIASLTSTEVPCGWKETPWRIVVPEGTTILLTFVTFGDPRGSQTATSQVTCQLYFRISTPNRGELDIRSCRGEGSQERIVYAAVVNFVNIVVVNTADRFLLKYQGNIVMLSQQTILVT